MRILVFLLCLVTSLAHAEQRVALVIGNSAYTAVPTLPNPANDARAVAERVALLGFEVTPLINGDKRAMDEALRAFGRRAAAADVAMVFYAGHGVQVDGRNYLVPIDAKPPVQTQDLRYDFVDVAAVMDELAGAHRLRIVVLDACRDNPIATQLSRSLGRSLGGSRGLAAPADMDNTLIAYATATDATAADGDGAHSPFTEALLEHIGDPGLDIRLMFGRVRDKVRRATSNRQNPFVYVSLGGDSFEFNPGAAPPIQPSSLPIPVPAPTPALQRPLSPPLAAPRLPAPTLDASIGGQWRLADGRGCESGGVVIQVMDGFMRQTMGGDLRFVRMMGGGRMSIAVERITRREGNVITTVVMSDTGTPQSQIGQRNRYTIENGRWTSQNLATGEQAMHVRC